MRGTGRSISHAHEIARTRPDHVHVRTAWGDGTRTAPQGSGTGLIVVLVYEVGSGFFAGFIFSRYLYIQQYIHSVEADKSKKSDAHNV